MSSVMPADRSSANGEKKEGFFRRMWRSLKRKLSRSKKERKSKDLKEVEEATDDGMIHRLLKGEFRLIYSFQMILLPRQLSSWPPMWWLG
ncbi:hypothetical protein L596_029229 [Steinernema carpocapsae]|uniref:Uncharacterized protein n=1 Tax=Steinernema carpocapsae TaxID=34508 RepID=A0A4U5LU07_STECR|nr:hypothetical protein L596_029229 [Steinernema carpocapsae]